MCRRLSGAHPSSGDEGGATGNKVSIGKHAGADGRRLRRWRRGRQRGQRGATADIGRDAHAQPDTNSRANAITHGTAVTNIIAAGRNGSGTVGYALSAAIVALRVADWEEKTQTEILSHTDEAIRYAADKGIKIVSSSLVGGSPGWTAATERLAATGGLLVNSAGNFAPILTTRSGSPLTIARQRCWSARCRRFSMRIRSRNIPTASARLRTAPSSRSA
ncbi:S8 family serine peptidase [Sphingomonas echinoides]|uniref:S8 family serine peptidase n=1 Tax=Sphingomonas echinoides TaxID=59803 RepID=UPI002413611C|nr:S8 family serine peptidase [Sphingomonas echinoides]